MSNDLTQIFGQDFNIDAIEATVDYIPPGKVPCLIERAELKETKKGTGHLIALVLSVLDDPHRNRKLFVNINIDNPSEQCVAIGLGTLKSLWTALALGAIRPGEDHISPLLQKIVIAHVRVKNEQNEVTTFSAPGTTQPAAPSAPPVPAQPPQGPPRPPAAQQPVHTATPEAFQQQARPAVRPWDK